MRKPPNNLREFSGLVQVVEILRGPDGCPWDKEQTHQTLTRFAIEEAFELSEAIDAGDTQEIRDELGDVLLQVVLHSEIAKQSGKFDISDVIESINDKMVRRHPHVFGDETAVTSEDVLKNWFEMKDVEKQKKGTSATAFDIPSHLPALMRSQKIGEKTEKLSFDWANAAECWPKIKEEIGELEEAMGGTDTGAAAESDSRDEIEAELGDVLFSIVQLARHLKVDAEQTLRKANARFEKRFHRMLELAGGAGPAWQKLSPAEKEKLWKAAKAK